MMSNIMGNEHNFMTNQGKYYTFQRETDIFESEYVKR